MVKNFKNNTLIDYLIAIFLSHIFYRITFIDSLDNELSIVGQIKNSALVSQNFFIESPTFTLIALGLGIESLDVYKLLIYAITLTCLLLIVLNVQYLGSYSTLFIFSGWLITCSWFLGYVDVLTVLIMVLIQKTSIKMTSFIKISLYFLFLSLNHNAISFAVSIIYLILANKNIR